MMDPQPAHAAARPRDQAFHQLREDLRARGCFRTAPWMSVLSLPLHVGLSAWMFAACLRVPVWAAVPLFVMASVTFYRLGWIMHDAAHGGVFATARANRVWASVSAAVLGEFPSGWRYGHNRHHAAPNVRGRDLDQSERWDPARRYTSMASACVGLLLFSTYKGVYLPKTLLLLGLRDGVYCWRTSRRTFWPELAGVLAGMGAQLAFMVAVFGAWGPWLMLAHTSVGMLYLNTVFAGNHYDLDAFNEQDAEPLGFAELQLRTTRNYPDGLWARFWFGGLEYQVEHHLFPSMPRHQLGRAAPAVQAFCKAQGLPYHVLPFGESIRRVLRFHVDRPSSPSPG